METTNWLSKHLVIAEVYSNIQDGAFCENSKRTCSFLKKTKIVNEPAVSWRKRITTSFFKVVYQYFDKSHSREFTTNIKEFFDAYLNNIKINFSQISINTETTFCDIYHNNVYFVDESS